MENKYLNNKDLLKTSKEWQEEYPEIKVLDPDGWDRNNFHFSWYEEKISLATYNSRLLYSTVESSIKNKK